MLKDLEEELLRIQDKNSRAYMEEAVRCYHAQAYRAAVVVAVAAIMDDLRVKLGVLAKSGGGSELVKASKNADKQFGNQKPFESNLLEGCHKYEVLTPDESSKLKSLLERRNACAHPSGHSGSAEEARDVIVTGIELVLARSARSGGAYARIILDERLSLPNLFSTEDRSIWRDIVSREASNLFGEKVRRYLVSSMFKKLISEDNGSVVKNNSSKYLSGLIILDEYRDIVWLEVESLLETGSAIEAIPVLMGDPEGLEEKASSTVRSQCINLVKREILGNSQDRVVKLLRLWLENSVLKETEKGELLNIFVVHRKTWNIDERTQDSTDKWIRASIRIERALEWTDYTEFIYESLLNGLIKGSFSSQNGVVGFLNQQDAESFLQRLDESQKAILLANICVAASRGADLAKRAISNSSRYTGMAKSLIGRPEIVSSEKMWWHWKKLEELLLGIFGKKAVLDFARRAKQVAGKAEERDIEIGMMHSKLDELRSEVGLDE